MTEQYGFGWLPSTPEKITKHQTVYAWSVFLPFVAARVEKVNTLNPKFRSWYNQGMKNACVGASTAQLMAQTNLPQVGPRQYNWWKHYCYACQIDHDTQTTCQADLGTYLWAGLDCLRLKGAYIDQWYIDDGIDRYFWINPTNAVDETRTAIAEGQLVSIGSPWFEGFNADRLVKVGDRWWFPSPSKWGRILGGHAYGWYDALDSVEGFGMVNTWGDAYPDKVYMDYKDYEVLHTRGAECAVLVDRNYNPPDPEPPPNPEPAEDKVEGTIYINSVPYKLVKGAT